MTQFFAHNETNCIRFELEQGDYLTFPRGGFALAICPNAIVEDHPCTFAMCIPCQMRKLKGGNPRNRGRKRTRAYDDDDMDEDDTSSDESECNHEDIQGLEVHENSSWFTEKWMEKHGCRKCVECNKLIKPKKSS